MRRPRHDVPPVLSKLTRILLAICTAFVFTGQMEVAAQHCARLALAADHCECIAVLKMCASIPAATASHTIAPYAWLTAATHGGIHAIAGGWILMGHATVDGVYSWQDGPRGDEKAFAAGMLMGTSA